MQAPRYTKSTLYNTIEQFRCAVGITPSDYPIDTRKIAKAGGLAIATHDFITRGLKGALVIEGERGYIILDKRENTEEQNFFCGHEMVHYLLHKDKGRSFQCFDKAPPNQDSIIEWQANEGALN